MIKRYWFVFLALTLLAGIADAQQATRSTFLKLMDIQELWEEERYTDALTDLDELIAKVADKPYDYALANQYLAHTAVMMGETERARPALEAALSIPDLPGPLEANLKMFYGQIIMADEEFELAKEMFDDWLAKTEEEPTAGQLFSVAYANYMSGHLEDSFDLISRAIDLKSPPPNNWIRLQYQILFDMKRYDEALAVATELVNRDPLSLDYWRLLASHHMRLEDYEQALAALSIAESQGVLTKEDDLRRIASLYGHVSVPEKAARLLQQWMQDERIEEDAKTWRQLGDLWMLARERENAKAALWKAVEGDPSASTLEFLAGIHFEDAEWEQSYDAFTQAIATGDIEAEDLPRIHMLAGLTAMRAGDKTTAREYLMLARQDEELRSQVNGLLRRLDES